MRASLALAAACSTLTNCSQAPKANPNFNEMAKQYAALPDMCHDADVNHSENVSTDNFSSGFLFKIHVSGDCRTNWISALAGNAGFKCSNEGDLPLDPQLPFVYCANGSDFTSPVTRIVFKGPDVEFLRVILT